MEKHSIWHGWKKWELALMLALCVTLTAGLWAQSRQQSLSDKLIRLHVIAASDSEEDQAVKLAPDDGFNLMQPGAETHHLMHRSLLSAPECIPDIGQGIMMLYKQHPVVFGQTLQQQHRRFGVFAKPGGIRYTNYVLSLYHDFVICRCNYFFSPREGLRLLFCGLRLLFCGLPEQSPVQLQILLRHASPRKTSSAFRAHGPQPGV